MLTEKSIVYSSGRYWVCKADNQYTVYINVATHSTADSSYVNTEDGLSIAIARCNYIAKKQKGESK